MPRAPGEVARTLTGAEMRAILAARRVRTDTFLERQESSLAQAEHPWNAKKTTKSHFIKVAFDSKYKTRPQENREKGASSGQTSQGSLKL